MVCGVVGAMYVQNTQERSHWKGDIEAILEGGKGANHVII